MCALDVFGAADGPVSASTLAEENLRLSVCPKTSSAESKNHRGNTDRKFSPPGL
jgi:hypothetical protein